MMKWKLLGTAVIALGLFLFSRHRKDGTGDTKAEKRSDIVSQASTAFTSDPAANSPESLPFKSKIRLNHRRPTKEETVELLRNTMIPTASFEDISIKEVLDELNRLTSEAGIPPEQLKFVRGAPHVFPDDYLELKVRELKVTNIPLADLLKYLVGRSKIVYVVDRGVVEFRDIHAPPDHPETVPPNLPEKASSGASDPFAPE